MNKVIFLIITEKLKKNLITHNKNLLANFKVLDLIGNLQFTAVGCGSGFSSPTCT